MDALLQKQTFERLAESRSDTSDGGTNQRTNNAARSGGEGSNHHVSSTVLHGVAIVSLHIDGKDRLCLAQISNTLLKDYSYNEIHNRRVALGITCVQCTPVQLEILRRAGAMPISSRRCGMITRHEAERLVRSFLADAKPPKLPENFAFDVSHNCGWGCRGSFIPARYNSSRAKCIKCATCSVFFSPNKFIFHFHRTGDGTYYHPDAANFNSWRRHLKLTEPDPPEDIASLWEEVKAMFNGGSRKRIAAPYRSSEHAHDGTSLHFKKRAKTVDEGAHALPPESDHARVTSSYPYPVYPTPSKLLSMKGVASHQAFTAPFPSYCKPPLPSPVTTSAGGFKLPPVTPPGWPPALHESFFPPYELIWAKHLGLSTTDLPPPPVPLPTVPECELPGMHSPGSSVSGSIDSERSGRHDDSDTPDPSGPAAYASAFTPVSSRTSTEFRPEAAEGSRLSPETHDGSRISPRVADVSRDSPANRVPPTDSDDDDDERNVDVDTIDDGEVGLLDDDDNNNSLLGASGKDAAVGASSTASVDGSSPVRLSVIEERHAASHGETSENSVCQDIGDDVQEEKGERQQQQQMQQQQQEQQEYQQQQQLQLQKQQQEQQQQQMEQQQLHEQQQQQQQQQQQLQQQQQQQHQQDRTAHDNDQDDVSQASPQPSLVVLSDDGSERKIENNTHDVSNSDALPDVPNRADYVSEKGQINVKCGIPDFSSLTKEQLERELMLHVESKKRLESDCRLIRESFQEQVMREKLYREEINKQLHAYRAGMSCELDQERRARYSLQQKLKEAHDALHSFSCKMLIANHPCMQCTYKESTLPR
ncbi:hypothetical protein LSAT2_006700 [Lamellibrachia satsuma]|nr:hypothetical protein LSAT2_006700 [Lamellibrachia satsuma]